MAKTINEEKDKNSSMTLMVIFLALLIFLMQAFRYFKEEGFHQDYLIGP